MENQVLLGTFKEGLLLLYFLTFFFFLIALGLIATHRLSLVTDSNLLVTFIAVRRPLTVGASPDAAHGALGTGLQ